MQSSVDSLDRSLYASRPLGCRDGIPIFSLEDEYTLNYEKISRDHVEHMDATWDDPFIPEGLWQESEDLTRRMVLKYAKQTDRLLDVGVGLGRLLGPLVDFERHGMDISWEYLRRATERGIECAYARVEDMPYEDDVFDLVVCTDVLEHVLDLHSSVEAVLRVLKKGGFLVVRVPYMEDMSGYASPDAPYEFIHLRTFDEWTLKLEFEKVFRCRVLEWATSGHVLTPERLRRQLIRGNRKLVSAVKAVNRVWPSRGQHLIDELFLPVEITMVVQRSG